MYLFHSNNTANQKTLQNHQITVETALETEKLKYANLVTNYDDLAKKKEHEYSDLQVK